MLAVAAQLVEEWSRVRARVEKHEEKRVGGEHADDSQSTRVLEDRGGDRATSRHLAKLVGRANHRGDVRRYILGVDGGYCLTIDEQSVAAEHDGGFDPIASANGGHQVADGGHRYSLRVAAKLGRKMSEVKRRQSLEVTLLRTYPSRRTAPRPAVSRVAMIRSTPAAMLLTLGLAAGAASCGNPFRPKAFVDTRLDTFSLYALTPRRAGVPNAINVTSDRAPEAVRVDETISFDVALDIDASGRIVATPIQLLVNPGIANRRVALLVDSVRSFDEVLTAPRSGYVDSLPVTFRTGQTLIIQSPSACPDPRQSPRIYAKVVVDSVRTSDRLLFVRATANLNCGFRSLEPGRPRN